MKSGLARSSMTRSPTSVNEQRFYTVSCCILYSLVFYEPTVLIIPLLYLGVDQIRRYTYCFRQDLPRYVHLYGFYNGLVMMGPGLNYLCSELD